jgi:transcriptional regulator with XRE-family HTH domain
MDSVNTMDRERLLALLKAQPRHERIATLRSLYDLSQKGLANVAKVARGTVSTWEAPTVEADGGRGHEPGKMARNRMAAYFGIPAYVFTDEWGSPTRQSKRGSRAKKVSDTGLFVPAPTNISNLNVKQL